MFSNIFGGFSFKMLSYTSIIATAFCWFVLSNRDAASFFGVLSVLGLLVESYNEKVEASTDRFYRELEQVSNESIRRFHDRDRDIADFKENCKDKCNLKSGR
jgi:hypothetical protein